MLKKLILYIAAVSAVAFCSCNKDEESIFEYEQSTSVIVSAFKLSPDEKVLDSLENVFFSIDLVEAKIFNADSLPYGTNVSRLIPQITAPSSASAVILEFPRPGKSDSIVNYITNSTDSIDFSHGPVKLRIMSQSGTYERAYEVKVNVHQVKPDTLAWKQMQSAKLPTGFTAIDASATIQCMGKFYTLTSSAGKYCMASAADPGAGEWDVEEASFPFTPDVESLRGGQGKAYILASDGALYESADMRQWTASGQTWKCIYGDYQDQIIGCLQDGNGAWAIASYPDGRQWAMPQGFPVSGASRTVSFSSPMGIAPQMVMVGGRDASGKLLAGAWSFDGESWAMVTRASLPLALEGMMVVPYSVVDVPSSTWSPVVQPVLMATGGRNDIGVNAKVFISYDWGMTWMTAPTLMQLPAAVPKAYGASAYVHSSVMHASRGGAWQPIETARLYPQCRWLEPASRVAKPETEWECPAIYMFGGRNPDDIAIDSVWRGVILRFTFQPLY